MTSWGRFERRFDAIIDDLSEHEKLVDKTASAVNLLEARKIRESVEAMRQESFNNAARQEEERTAMQYVTIVGWLKMDDSQQLRIIDSITTESERYPCTSSWIFNQQKVAAWMRCSQESTFLVLHGRPGTGKSVLLTQIGASLKSSGRSLVISHFCTYSQPSSTEYDHILRSILLQLVRSNTDLVAYIYEEFILRKKPATTQALERLILTVIRDVADTPSQPYYVHVIVDGLDECESEKQPKIFNLLERMVSEAFSSNSTVCKVLTSSHMPPTVRRKMKQKHLVSLSEESAALEKSIAKYAARRLGLLRCRWFQMGIRDFELKDLECRIAKKANGEFKSWTYTS
jgi:Cdc6-like AAA superfamily ATPase